MSQRKHPKRRVIDAQLDAMLERQDAREAFLSGDLLREFKEALAGRALQAEMEAHLEKTEKREAGNHRNGSSSRRVLTDHGQIDLAVPRDRHGRFEAQLVEKYVRRLPDSDQKVISMYARGLTTRRIRGHIQELYGVSASRELISKVTDAVHQEVERWQKRRLEKT